MDVSSAMIEDVDDLDLIPDDELEETYLERIIGLRGKLCSVLLLLMFSAVCSSITVKPRFTGPLGGKELDSVNQEARYIRVHYMLIYTQSFFLGLELRPG